MSNTTKKRIGDDLYLYNGNHVLIIEDFYDKKDKRKKKKKKNTLKSNRNKILLATFLTALGSSKLTCLIFSPQL